MVASVFEANHNKQLLGKVKNVVYNLWGPVHFAFKMQVNSKQLRAAFLLLCKVN
jgi:hypothetical protein